MYTQLYIVVECWARCTFASAQTYCIIFINNIWLTFVATNVWSNRVYRYCWNGERPGINVGVLDSVGSISNIFHRFIDICSSFFNVWQYVCTILYILCAMNMKLVCCEQIKYGSYVSWKVKSIFGSQDPRQYCIESFDEYYMLTVCKVYTESMIDFFLWFEK